MPKAPPTAPTRFTRPAAANPAVIVASIAGRLRLRNARLRHPRHSDEASATLRALAGVNCVTANPTVGSLLVHYDATHVRQPEMEARVLAALAALLPADVPVVQQAVADTAPPRSNRRQAAREWNRAAKLGMLASLPVSLALAAGGAKKLHAVTGGVFTALLLVHLAVHRRHLVK